MDYQQAREYICRAQKYGIVPGLLNMIALCEALGNIQNKIKVVQIAGTNGKGSVGTFLERILAAAGYRVGRYTSPAVLDIRECYQAGGEWITREEYARCVQKTAEAAEALQKSGIYPTAFELETAAAFLFFYEKQCDIVLLEAGMGGGQDATNVTKGTVLSVITSISRDHCKFLGNTAAQIAREKAGIMKENGCVVSAGQEEAVQAVLQEKAGRMHASLTFCGPVRNLRGGIEGLSFDYGELKGLQIFMGGDFQGENAALAVEAACKLNTLGFPLTRAHIRQGLKTASWPGRFQVVPGEPLFILDGAHNPDGILRLYESVARYLKGKRIAAVTGVFRDKEFDRMAAIIAPICHTIFTVTPPGPRGLNAEEWAAVLRKYHNCVTACADTAAAASAAAESGCDTVLCFGSLSYLAQVLEWLKKVGRLPTEKRR